jgi:hypothetical protein
MSTGEHIVQPPFYDELFNGFAGMAIMRGLANYGPLDPALEPGNDGTITPDGEQAYGFDYVINADKLPQAIIEIGIDEVEIGTYASTIVEGKIWPARVWISTHEQVGITKAITFYKDKTPTRISATLNVEADTVPVPKLNDQRLTPEQRNEIINDLFSGQQCWLRLEGGAGNFARAAHLVLSTQIELDAYDTDSLRDILAVLSKTM